MGRRAAARRMGMFVPPLLGSALLLAACGGGTMTAGGGTGGTGISVGSITATGSITVNGVKFDDAPALISIDDNTSKTPADLGLGMTVKVRGRFNADGVNGTAERIEVENEARGTVTVVDAETFTVLGQTVVVDGATFWQNDGGLKMGALAAGPKVEVHGFRDNTATIRATRVEVLGATPAEDELRGTVSQKTDATFTIGSMLITHGPGTEIVPAGAEWDNGTLVEVHLDGAGVATRIEVEGLEDVMFDPAEGEEVEVEGFVYGIAAAGDNAFFVGDRAVVLAADVRYKGGLPGDLRDGVLVEAKGRIVAGGAFVADEIDFDDPVRIEANADSAGSANVLGKTVRVTSRTVLEDLPGGIAGIQQGAGLRVRGFLNNDNTTITATEIVGRSNPVGDNEVVLQGAVTGFEEAERRLTILGLTVDASEPSVLFKDDRDDDAGGDQPISAAQFFGALVPGSTIVKAKGTFGAGPPPTLTAVEAELE